LYSFSLFFITLFFEFVGNPIIFLPAQPNVLWLPLFPTAQELENESKTRSWNKPQPSSYFFKRHANKTDLGVSHSTKQKTKVISKKQRGIFWEQNHPAPVYAVREEKRQRDR
jgi:hypothetical protein